MTKVRTYNGIKSGEVVNFDNSQGKQQWMLGDQFLAITTNIPEVKTDDSWRAEYTTKSIFNGRFFTTTAVLIFRKAWFRNRAVSSRSATKMEAQKKLDMGINSKMEQLFQ